MPGVAAMGFMTMAPLHVGARGRSSSRARATPARTATKSPSPATSRPPSRACCSPTPTVAPIGLGARDSLRLEAGLCLYGHDIDETTTPVEANLTWAIGKRRKLEQGFPGDARIMDQLFNGAKRLRVGIKPEGRAPAREGAEIVDATGAVVGRITSGGFGPSVNGPVAMGYVSPNCAADGTELGLMVRGQKLPARVVPLPFIPKRFHKP